MRLESRPRRNPVGKKNTIKLWSAWSNQAFPNLCIVKTSVTKLEKYVPELIFYANFLGFCLLQNHPKTSENQRLADNIEGEPSGG
jgi:hypothetical protein